MNLDVGGIINGVGGVLDELFTSDEERSKAKLALTVELQKIAIAQLEVNKAEATHDSVFVAGWRPAVGWVCALIFLYALILRDLLIIGLSAGGIDLWMDLPQPDMAMMMPVLMGMLGLVGSRSWEKTKGVARSGLNRSTPKEDVFDPPGGLY